MSTCGQRIKAKQAYSLAERIKAAIEGSCESCMIVGSLRRHAERLHQPDLTVGDIEIICIPKLARPLIPDIEGANLLFVQLNALVGRGRLIKANHLKSPYGNSNMFYLPALKKDGNDFKVEIIASTPARWGIEVAIRTGSATFSKRLVRQREKGGYLPDGHTIRDGWQLYDGARPIKIDSERQFLEYTVGHWVWPAER